MIRAPRALLGLALFGCDVAPPVGRADGGGPTSDGWEAPLGAGAVGIVPWMQIMPPTEGLDLDGRCDGARCADNALGVAAQLLNLSGAPTPEPWAIELAGLDDPLEDPEVTVKIFRVRRGDGVDFGRLGWTARPEDIGPDGQPHQRLPARVVAGTIETVGPSRIGPRPDGLTQGHLPLVQARLQIGPTNGFAASRRLVLGGVVTAGAARAAPPPPGFDQGPYRSLVAFLAAAIGPPDLDLDGDGLERLTWSEGRLVCYDGCRARCPTPAPLPSFDGDDVTACAGLPEMADGWSVAFVGDLDPLF